MRDVKRQNAVKPALIVGAVLLLGSVTSQAQTPVKQFTMSMGNPDNKGIAELYAIGVEHGFFWYQVMMVARSRPGMGSLEMPLFCLPDNTPFTEKIILDAARCVIGTARGDDTFEIKLLGALMEMLPCIGPLMDVFLHEAGHAVFGSLQIPLFGRGEDATDQFSTYMMLKFEARRLILGSAYQYKGDMASPTITITQQKFADAHGTPAERFFNLLCTAYGSDPNLFADVVEKGFLPEDRAVACKREYIQLSHAFATLIGPHVDRKLARKLHKRWLPPVTTKPRLWEGQTD